MRLRRALLFAGCLLSVVSAQWLEAVIPAGGRWNGMLDYNDLHNKVYAGNYDSTVLVFDAVNNSVIREVTVGTRPMWLRYNWNNDRLYCALGGTGGSPGDTVSVIDGRTDELVRQIHTTSQNNATVEFNHVNNKLYVCTGGMTNPPDFLSVIDCDGDTETNAIQLPGDNWPHCPAYVEGSNKVYVPIVSSDFVMVLDGASDSIIKDSLRVGAGAMCGGVDTRRNNVYFTPWNSDSLVVVDGDSDSVAGRIRVGFRPECWEWNWTNDRIYCTTWGDSNFVVIDAVTLERIDERVFSRPKDGLFWNPLNNKVYLLDSDTNNVLVLDGASNQVVTTIDLPAHPAGLAWNWQQNRLYVACSPGGDLAVIRDSGGYAVAETPSAELRTTNGGPTIIRGVLVLPSSLLSPPSSLLSVDGRKVLDLRPGPNDVSRLSPGVYFVRAVGRELSAVSCRKVVIPR